MGDHLADSSCTLFAFSFSSCELSTAWVLLESCVRVACSCKEGMKKRAMARCDHFNFVMKGNESGLLSCPSCDGWWRVRRQKSVSSRSTRAFSTLFPSSSLLLQQHHHHLTTSDKRTKTTQYNTQDVNRTETHRAGRRLHQDWTLSGPHSSLRAA